MHKLKSELTVIKYNIVYKMSCANDPIYFINLIKHVAIPTHALNSINEYKNNSQYNWIQTYSVHSIPGQNHTQFTAYLGRNILTSQYICNMCIHDPLIHNYLQYNQNYTINNEITIH